MLQKYSIPNAALFKQDFRAAVIGFRNQIVYCPVTKVGHISATLPARRVLRDVCCVFAMHVLGCLGRYVVHGPTVSD